jgi:hypothetical protein
VREGDLAGFFKNKWTRRLALWVLASVALIYGFIQLNYPTCTFRYKLTAEVMTPEGLKSGSSVIEVSYRDFYSLSGVPNLMLSAKGEAAMIAIDSKRIFVVTLIGTNRNGVQFRDYDDKPEHMKSGLDLHALPLKTFGLQWKDYDERALAQQIEGVKQSGKKSSPTFQNLPMLVVFNDIANPDSVVEVDPNGLDRTLGAGFALQNVWLELTDEEPTDTGMKIFPWWEEKIKEWESKWIFSIDDKLIDQLYYRAFKQPTIVGKAR